MSNATHYITNGNNITGVLWENEKLGKVFVLMNKIDANFDLEVRDCNTSEVINHVDLRDFLLESLPYEENKQDESEIEKEQ